MSIDMFPDAAIVYIVQQRTMEQVREALTPELLAPKYRDNPKAHCYVASEALYHLLGGKAAGLTPQQIQHEGASHWFLRTASGDVLDPTSDQFETPVPYDQAVGRGFLTSQPSARARIVIEKVTA